MEDQLQDTLVEKSMKDVAIPRLKMNSRGSKYSKIM
jgi:hypothetical protein